MDHLNLSSSPLWAKNDILLLLRVYVYLNPKVPCLKMNEIYAGVELKKKRRRRGCVIYVHLYRAGHKNIIAIILLYS